MIHSLAGGELGKVSFHNFAKVKFLEGINEGCIAWFICDGFFIEAGDLVLVEGGTKAQVIRVDTNVSSQTAPVNVKRAKKILKKL